MNRRPALLAVALLVAACGGPAATIAPPSTPPAAQSTDTPAPLQVATPTPATPVPTTATPKPAILPGERWLAFQDDAGGGVYGVRLVRPDGSGLFFPTVTAGGREQLHPDWSPDGKRLVFSTLGAAARDLWVTDADGANPEHIVVCDACAVADEPAWSPDGASIAFQRQALVGDAWVSTLELYDVATRKTRVVMTAARGRTFYAPRWSPDGMHIVAEYVRRRDGATDREDYDGGELAIVDTTVARPSAKVLTDEGWPANPDWSPDGKLIVFFRPVDSQKFDAEADLWTIRPDGTDLRQLTHYAAKHAFASQPTFTPDGARIAFVTAPADGSSDWVMATISADGSDPQPATSSGYLRGVHPRFRPTP